MMKELQKSFGIAPDKTNKVYPQILKYNLTASELEKADMLAELYSNIDVELRWERRCRYFVPELGEVRQTDGTEVGISGWEKRFNDRLSGKAGTFTVMLDRYGKWLNSTFRITQAAVNGEDIFLSEELSNGEAQ